MEVWAEHLTHAYLHAAITHWLPEEQQPVVVDVATRERRNGPTRVLRKLVGMVIKGDGAIAHQMLAPGALII